LGGAGFVSPCGGARVSKGAVGKGGVYVQENRQGRRLSKKTLLCEWTGKEGDFDGRTRRVYT